MSEISISSHPTADMQLQSPINPELNLSRSDSIANNDSNNNSENNTPDTKALKRAASSNAWKNVNLLLQQSFSTPVHHSSTINQSAGNSNGNSIQPSTVSSPATQKTGLDLFINPMSSPSKSPAIQSKNNSPEHGSLNPFMLNSGNKKSLSKYQPTHDASEGDLFATLGENLSAQFKTKAGHNTVNTSSVSQPSTLSTTVDNGLSNDSLAQDDDKFNKLSQSTNFMNQSSETDTEHNPRSPPDSDDDRQHPDSTQTPNRSEGVWVGGDSLSANKLGLMLNHMQNRLSVIAAEDDFASDPTLPRQNSKLSVNSSLSDNSRTPQTQQNANAKAGNKASATKPKSSINNTNKGSTNSTNASSKPNPNREFKSISNNVSLSNTNNNSRLGSTNNGSSNNLNQGIRRLPSEDESSLGSATINSRRSLSSLTTSTVNTKHQANTTNNNNTNTTRSSTPSSLPRNNSGSNLSNNAKKTPMDAAQFLANNGVNNSVASMSTNTKRHSLGSTTAPTSTLTPEVKKTTAPSATVTASSNSRSTTPHRLSMTSNPGATSTSKPLVASGINNHNVSSPATQLITIQSPEISKVNAASKTSSSKPRSTSATRLSTGRLSQVESDSNGDKIKTTTTTNKTSTPRSNSANRASLTPNTTKTGEGTTITPTRSTTPQSLPKRTLTSSVDLSATNANSAPTTTPVSISSSLSKPRSTSRSGIPVATNKTTTTATTTNRSPSAPSTARKLQSTQTPPSKTSNESATENNTNTHDPHKPSPAEKSVNSNVTPVNKSKPASKTSSIVSPYSQSVLNKNRKSLPGNTTNKTNSTSAVSEVTPTKDTQPLTTIQPVSVSPSNLACTSHESNLSSVADQTAEDTFNGKSKGLKVPAPIQTNTNSSISPSILLVKAPATPTALSNANSSQPTTNNNTLVSDTNRFSLNRSNSGNNASFTNKTASSAAKVLERTSSKLFVNGRMTSVGENSNSAVSTPTNSSNQTTTAVTNQPTTAIVNANPAVSSIQLPTKAAIVDLSGTHITNSNSLLVQPSTNGSMSNSNISSTGLVATTVPTSTSSTSVIPKIIVLHSSATLVTPPAAIEYMPSLAHSSPQTIQMIYQSLINAAGSGVASRTGRSPLTINTITTTNTSSQNPSALVSPTNQSKQSLLLKTDSGASSPALAGDLHRALSQLQTNGTTANRNSKKLASPTNKLSKHGSKNGSFFGRNKKSTVSTSQRDDEDDWESN